MNAAATRKRADAHVGISPIIYTDAGDGFLNVTIGILGDRHRVVITNADRDRMHDAYTPGFIVDAQGYLRDEKTGKLATKEQAKQRKAERQVVLELVCGMLRVRIEDTIGWNKRDLSELESRIIGGDKRAALFNRVYKLTRTILLLRRDLSLLPY